MLRTSPFTGQVRVYTRSGGCYISRKQIPCHEADGVIKGVLSRLETIDTLDDVQPAKPGVVSGDSLALDNRMRIVFIVFLANILEKDRDVCSSIGSWSVGR